jgi:Lar family restriction alleviation protein
MRKPELIRCCPFCGSHRVNINRTNENACWVSCAECEAESPSRPYREDAIAIWNHRHFDETYASIEDDDEKEAP